MSSGLALTDEQVKLVQRLLDAVIPGAKVAVFGSRATGRARPHSDLDLLVIDPPRLTWLQLADLRDAFDASPLPFRVDIVEAGGLAPGMAARVAAEQRPLTPEPAPSGSR